MKFWSYFCSVNSFLFSVLVKVSVSQIQIMPGHLVRNTDPHEGDICQVETYEACLFLVYVVKANS